MKKRRIGNAFPMGATVIDTETVQFVTKINKKKNTVLVLYEKKTGKREEYEFTQEYQIGNIYSMVLEDLEFDKYTYNYMENGKEFPDPYVKIVYGNEEWGKPGGTVSGGIVKESYDWEEDQQLMTPYNQSIIYQLHVRGFTRHLSSGVKKKGTFE